MGRSLLLSALTLTLMLSGCGAALVPTVTPAPAQPITSITPSNTGIPLGIALFRNYEFVSVQQTGQIFTYNIASGVQVTAGAPYSTPCAYPSGMVITTIGAINVMAVPCYDTGSLVTLRINTDGSLSPLGSVSGLGIPYPGIALDGTSVLVPLFGVNNVSNGGVAKVSIATPSTPVIAAITPLASPPSGGYANPGFLTVAGGYIYVAAGSESSPLSTSSTIQVLNESSMALVGNPFVVAHSPQQIAVSGTFAYVSFYDAMQLESIDISNPASLQALQLYSLANPPGCHALPVLLSGTFAYVGCNAEGNIQKLDVSKPSAIKPVATIPGIPSPQDFALSGDTLVVTSSASGGSVFLVDLDAPSYP